MISSFTEIPYCSAAVLAYTVETINFPPESEVLTPNLA